MADVVVVTSPACHLCEDALATLQELGREYPLSVREVELASDEGHTIFERFRPPLPPFVIVDGALFSAGRLPRKKLRKHLDRVTAVV
jgi:thioredoxin-like negative regulator of GroEL